MEVEADLADDVDCAHDHLIKMPVLHQIDVADEAVFKARPDLGAELGVNLQPVAEVTQSDTRQMIHLEQTINTTTKHKKRS